jgi:hypothetical protein
LNEKTTLFTLALALLAGGALAADPAAPARPRANPDVSCLIQPSSRSMSARPSTA